ncbi:MAG: hypothetical protein V3U86_12850 [Acidobacteriota bacterium]
MGQAAIKTGVARRSLSPGETEARARRIIYELFRPLPVSRYSSACICQLRRFVAPIREEGAR